MISTVAALPTLEDLAGYVRKVLCEHDSIDPEQAPFERAVVTRSGRPCGLMFRVSGPRRMKTYAIWAGEENRILFYDTAGVRFQVLQLSEAPDPASLGSLDSQ